MPNMARYILLGFASIPNLSILERVRDSVGTKPYLVGHVMFCNLSKPGPNGGDSLM